MAVITRSREPRALGSRHARQRRVELPEDADKLAGSQLGSQRRQILGYVRPQSASKRAARWHVRPHLALSGDGLSVPWQQRIPYHPLLPGP